MKPYVVQQGDYLSRIALQMGVDAQAIWDHPKNAEVKQSRAPDLLHPGDVLYIPDEAPKELELQIGSTNRYEGRAPGVPFTVALRDAKGPIANEKYHVEGPGPKQEGTTDGDGNVKLQVPVNARMMKVVVPSRQMVVPVDVGDMDPVEEPSGTRKRLVNLGYYRGLLLEDAPHDDPEECQLWLDRQAIAAFQKAEKLEETGEANEQTRARLVQRHGS